MVTVLEHGRISPPLGSVPESSLPLTFFDVPWLLLHPIHRVHLYEFPHSRTYFTHAHVPNLKHSLSLTLKHFFPLAGNLILPSSVTRKPEIRYADGDSVSLTFAECTNDFNYLTGNHARNADDFHNLVPQVPPVTYDAFGSRVSPILAIQVTLFPNNGICVGFTFDHAVGDASTLLRFTSAWASITKLGCDAPLLEAGGSLIPCYDRSVIKDPKGLYSIYWTQVVEVIERKRHSQPQHHLPINKVRATFVMGRADIEVLKKLILAKRPALTHSSSFTIVCAYVWTCMAKSRGASGENVHDDDLEKFAFVADCRARLDPPIPTNYFGNCLAPTFALAKTTQLLGEEGFLNAAELIGKAIHNLVNNEKGILHDSKTWISNMVAMKDQRAVTVAGSPKFNFYDIDFGWGKPKKLETVSIDYRESMSLSACKESEGDLEIGVSLPKIKMDAFVNIFANGLKIKV